MIQNFISGLISGTLGYQSYSFQDKNVKCIYFDINKGRCNRFLMKRKFMGVEYREKCKLLKKNKICGLQYDYPKSKIISPLPLAGIIKEIFEFEKKHN